VHPKHLWIGILLLVAVLAWLTSVTGATAQSACGQGLVAPVAEHQMNIRVGRYQGLGEVCDLGTAGFSTGLRAAVSRPSDEVRNRGAYGPPAGWVPNAGANPLDLIRLFCRRDDYAFLPQGANGGLPCTTTTSGGSIDPGEVARDLFGRLSLPSLRLDMNPRLGLVAVPTWFWVEGYGGEVIPLSRTLTVPHERCTLDVQRDARGDAVLDAVGNPVMDRRCTTTLETIGVEVRAWPSMYHWNFGDKKDQVVVCYGSGACTAGLGRAYTDPNTPSPIQHAYRFSSLGQQGATDAYGIQLAITFSAEYRFSRNGAAVNGWQGLPNRELSWSADHKVQEAQAVLVRP
jgi:hypothetical protein